jgi:SAM-dependent methyltransferase
VIGLFGGGKANTFELGALRLGSKSKELLKRALSRRTQLALRIGVNTTKAGFLSFGSSVECPICNRAWFRLLQFDGRSNEWCPSCRSLGRHRLTYLYLRHRTDILIGRRPIRILHIGPEFCLKPRLAEIPKAKYVSMDSLWSFVEWLEVRPDICASITRTCFPSGTFDLVLCSHVLEHVKDDRTAIAELFRITKPGGRAIVPVPISWSRERTDEREGLTDSQRSDLYGAWDHVRRYGRDYR